MKKSVLKFSVIIGIILTAVLAQSSMAFIRNPSASNGGSGGSTPAAYVVAPAGGDYTSVAAAVTAACAATPAGGNVFIRGGTYTETTQILGCTNLHIIADQAATIQINQNSTGVTTFFTAASGSSKINIEGGKWLQSSGTIGSSIGFDMSNMSNTWIHHLRIEGFNLAVRYNDTANVTFYNSLNDVQLFDNNNCVEYSGTQANNNNLYNVRCRPKAGGGGIGLSIIDSRGITSTGSDWEPSAAGSITGISIDATSREIDIVNNWVEGNFVGLSIASGATRVNVLGGSITSNTTDISDLGTSTCFINTSLTGVTRNTCGSFGATTVTKTATYTATVNDYTILCDATAGAVTINLPTAASAIHKVINMKKIDAVANACTLDGSGAETIDGAATKSTTTQYFNYQIQSNGTAWYIL